MAKVFGNAGKIILKGLQQYVLEVTTKEFPQSENWFTIKEDEFEELLRLLEE